MVKGQVMAAWLGEQQKEMKIEAARLRHGERLKERAFDILALNVQQAYFVKHAYQMYCQNLQKKVFEGFRLVIEQMQAQRELESEI